MRRYFKTNPTIRLINDQNATIRDLNRKLREARHQLRSERARANDYAHLLAVNGFGSAGAGSDRNSSDNAATG